MVNQRFSPPFGEYLLFCPTKSGLGEKMLVKKPTERANLGFWAWACWGAVNFCNVSRFRPGLQARTNF